MKSLTKATLASALVLAVTACGGKDNDSPGDNVAEAYEAKADNVDDDADNAATENTADALRKEGQRKQDAIDRSDAETRATRAAQKEPLTNKK
ncbi:MAG: hypothetical protein ACK440_07305 [Sphingomonadaceae bacterium]